MPATQSTGKLFRVEPTWTGQIGSGGVPDATTTTIPLASASGLQEGMAYIFTIDRVDANGNKTPSKKETCVGVLSGTNFINCQRGVEGTAQPHSVGAIVEILWTAKNVNELIDALETLGINPDTGYAKHIALENQPSTPATPPAGKSVVYIDESDKLLKYLLSSGAVYAAELYDGLYRQALINGNFDIWQRGTSFNQVGFTSDRWFLWSNGSSYSVTRDTDVPDVKSKYSLKGTVSLNNDNWFNLGYRLEDKDAERFSNKTVTFSFYHKDTVDSGTADIRIFIGYPAVDGGGYDNAEWMEVTQTPISLSSIWKREVITFTVPATSPVNGYPVSNGMAIEIRYHQVSGSGNLTVRVSQVQLNIGEIALPFMPRSLEEELRKCQRYYEKSYDLSVDPGTITTNGCEYWITNADPGCIATNTVRFKVRKRKVPAVTLYSTNSGASGVIFCEDTGADESAGVYAVGERSFAIRTILGSTTDARYQAHWTADADIY